MHDWLMKLLKPGATFVRFRLLCREAGRFAMLGIESWQKVSIRRQCQIFCMCFDAGRNFDEAKFGSMCDTAAWG